MSRVRPTARRRTRSVTKKLYIRPESPGKWEALTRELLQVRAVQLRYFLAYRGLPDGKNDTHAESAERVAAYVEQQSLTEAEVLRGVSEMREWGNKSVHLFTFDRDATPALDRLGEGRVATLDLAHLRKSIPPRVSYWHLDERARVLTVAWTEQQGRLTVDKAHLTVDETPVPVCVVLSADFATGNASLRYDSFAGRAIHASQADYEKHYFDLAQSVLGTRPVRRSLSRAIESLESSALVRLEDQDARIGHTRTRMVIEGDGDLRQEGTFQMNQAAFEARLKARYQWLPGHPPQDVRWPSLLRPIRCDVFGPEGIVRFPIATMPEEAQYVLGHIGAHNR